MIQFKLLGTGAGPGVPSFFCDCCACQEAQSEPKYQRTRSGAVVQIDKQNILIDTPPDLRVQLLRENITSVAGIFLTHWHYDHFGGLGELEYYVKLKRKTSLPIYLPPSAISEFTAAFPNLTDVLAVQSWEFFKSYAFAGVTIMPLPANHSIETAGFFIATEQTRLAYFPDTAGLCKDTMELINNVNYFIGDATFNEENWFPNAHMNMQECRELGQRVHAKQIIFTHLAMHYSQPTTVRQIKTVFTEEYINVGYDGMSFIL